MTIASTTNKTAEFAAAVSTLPFTFPVFSQDDVDVILINASTLAETTLVRGTHYTVSLLYLGAGGGTVTLDPTAYPSGIPTGYTGYVKRILDETQQIDLKNQGDWFPEVHEEAFDRAVMLIQQLQEEVDRTLKTDNAHTRFDAENLNIRNLATGTDASDAVNLAQMQAADSSTYAAAVAAAFAAMVSWVTSYVQSYFPSIAPIVASDIVVPSSQDLVVGQTRIYFPVPVYGIILSLNGVSQGSPSDFTFTAGNSYVDLTFSPTFPMRCSAFIYSSSTPGTTAFSHLEATLSAGVSAVTMPSSFKTGLLFRNGIAQFPVTDYTHISGSDQVNFPAVAVIDEKILVVKFS